MVANTTQNAENSLLNDDLITALEQSLSAGDFAEVVALLKLKLYGKPYIQIHSTEEDYENLTRLMVMLAEPRPELLIDHPQNEAIRALCQNLVDQLKAAKKATPGH